MSNIETVALYRYADRTLSSEDVAYAGKTERAGNYVRADDVIERLDAIVAEALRVHEATGSGVGAALSLNKQIATLQTELATRGQDAESDATGTPGAVSAAKPNTPASPQQEKREGPWTYDENDSFARRVVREVIEAMDRSGVERVVYEALTDVDRAAFGRGQASQPEGDERLARSALDAIEALFDAIDPNSAGTIGTQFDAFRLGLDKIATDLASALGSGEGDVGGA